MTEEATFRRGHEGVDFAFSFVGATIGRPRAFTERPYEVVIEFRVCVGRGRRLPVCKKDFVSASSARNCGFSPTSVGEDIILPQVRN